MFSPTRVINFYFRQSKPKVIHLNISRGGKKIKSKFDFKSLFALKIRQKVRGNRFDDLHSIFHQRQLIICIVWKLTRFLVSSLKIVHKFCFVDVGHKIMSKSFLHSCMESFVCLEWIEFYDPSCQKIAGFMLHSRLKCEKKLQF